MRGSEDSEFGRLCLELGFSRSRVAEIFGVHVDTVSRWGGDPPAAVLSYLRLVKRVRKVGSELAEFE